MQRDDYAFMNPVTPGMISVILPSRNRTALLERSLQSLLNLAAAPLSCDVIIAFDNDDPQSRNDVARFLWNFRTINTGERRGWKGLHLYYADLLRHSKGEWILMWGDDGLMRTRHWDQIVRAQKPGVLHVKGGPSGGHNVFPIVHRKVILGVQKIIPSPHTDTWWTEVAMGAGCLYQVPIEITEDRYNETGNNNDQTFREGSIHQYRQKEYYSKPFTDERQRDIFRLAEECLNW